MVLPVRSLVCVVSSWRSVVCVCVCCVCACMRVCFLVPSWRCHVWSCRIAINVFLCVCVCLVPSWRSVMCGLASYESCVCVCVCVHEQSHL